MRSRIQVTPENQQQVKDFMLRWMSGRYMPSPLDGLELLAKGAGEDLKEDPLYEQWTEDLKALEYKWWEIIIPKMNAEQLEQLYHEMTYEAEEGFDVAMLEFIQQRSPKEQELYKLSLEHQTFEGALKELAKLTASFTQKSLAVKRKAEELSKDL